jgi:hypothetical protein
MADSKVSVRRQGQGDLGMQDATAFIAAVKKEIAERIG